ncbi:MAG: hypothetical protein JWM86_1395 [Thermoleophilia bacterium]|nr:hypothetical protein [Thermoleophilia bacterium]
MTALNAMHGSTPVVAPTTAATAATPERPHAAPFLKGAGIGLGASGIAMALASLPAGAAKGRGAHSGLLFAGLGATMLGIGALATWRMRQDAAEAAVRPGVQPGGGPGDSAATIPATVTGATGDLGTTQSRGRGPKVELATLATGLGQLTQVTSAPGDRGLWLVEKTGKLLHRGTDGTVETRLDISSLVDGGGERGLLSVAFHPRFQANAREFLYYTDKADGALHIAEAHAGRDGTVERESLKDLMTIPHERGNHNGGQLQFGPDGMLYAGTGDGGGGGDPDENSQDPGEHLGKLLRLDVDHPEGGRNYGIPTDNPFVGTAGAQPEVYATGVRNPWRFSFDRDNGDLWVGDVGQGKLEEVNYVPRGQGRGANFGWDVREGTSTHEAGELTPGRLIDPALQYGRDEGFSITGGYVYRGSDIPSLKGYYVYSDLGSDALRAMKVEDGKVVDRREMPSGSGREYTVSYGEGPDGELYAVTLGGELTKVVREGAGPVDGPDAGQPAGSATTLDIGVGNGNMRFDRGEYHVKAGRVKLEMKNTDTSGMPHNIGVEGNGVAKMSDMARTGQTTSVTVDLEPGEYELYCAPHRGGGMVAKLVVEE